MPLLVVGSVALDSVETPKESRDNVLGGSAVYFSYAASYFTSVRLVGVVGEDWPPEHTDLLNSRQIDTSGLTVVPGEKTFFWKGKYLPNMNDRETLEVQLNVFGDFQPKLPEDFRRCPFLVPCQRFAKDPTERPRPDDGAQSGGRRHDGPVDS